ncbi:hypothetical protein [Enterococcus sp. AZ109]|uniref:hypothetical protein n=1 Tax=Enterococcus sp. AZ109 TaxID=2774634 RepID=UPI003F214965
MSRVNDRKNGLSQIQKIDGNKKDYLIIHYSSESFFDLRGKSPRITSIAVENLEYGQSELFAIYKSAEAMKIDFESIPERYPEIEKSMLADFFDYAKLNQHKKWLHWNMRDSLFGFKALEHRFQVLGGEPYKIIDSNQINIASLFKSLYGSEYVEDPKMVSLMKKNNLEPKNYLSGADEAKAFNEGKYFELSMSSAGKVRMFSQMVNLAIDDTLVTDIKKRDIYGLGVKAKWYWLKDSLFFGPIMFILGAVMSAVIGYLVEKGLGM